MNRRSPSRRRFRVVARPQARARRARLFAAVSATAILGAIAFASARHAVGVLGRVRAALPAAVSSGPADAVVEGVSDPFRTLAQAAADSVTGSAGEKAAEIKRRFPCVSDVDVRRAWGDKRTVLTPVLRRAIAPALRRGRAAGFLADDGAVFAAPEGVYSPSGATADVGDADDAERRALAREWPVLTAPGAFPSPLVEMAFESEADGWRARLADGTTALWGRLEWTKDKLARLGEALNDARGKNPGAFAADLRWFEDGKVLLRPAAQTVAAGPHGGVR
ncbi:MAG: hypothetical protein ACHQ51_15285 [Elusimicrobiota bacterium]